MSSYTCKYCKYGHENTPDGRKIPQGTVWCSKRKIPMGQSRNLSCFIPLVSEKTKKCIDCKWAKISKPSGETPQLGRIWCMRKHEEMNKMRTMECFE